MSDEQVKKDKHGLMRRENGTLLPGQRSNSPGRPKGVERRIRELVDSQREKGWDGRDLDGWDAMALAMYSVAMGRTPPGSSEVDIKWKDRAEAIRFLYDRVWGKPMVRVETDNVTNSAGRLANIDVEKLDTEDLEALERHVEALAAKAAGLNPPATPQDKKELEALDAELLKDPDPDKVG